MCRPLSRLKRHPPRPARPSPPQTHFRRNRRQPTPTALRRQRNDRRPWPLGAPVATRSLATRGRTTSPRGWRYPTTFRCSPKHWTSANSANCAPRSRSVTFTSTSSPKNGDGDLIVVENQFGPTDHTHLGQIMTYVGGAGGKGDDGRVDRGELSATPHRAAVDWLNANTIAGLRLLRGRDRGPQDPAPRPRPAFQRRRRSEQLDPRDREQRGLAGAASPMRPATPMMPPTGQAFESFLKERGAQYKLPDPLPEPSTVVVSLCGRPGLRLFASAQGVTIGSPWNCDYSHRPPKGGI